MNTLRRFFPSKNEKKEGDDKVSPSKKGVKRGRSVNQYAHGPSVSGNLGRGPGNEEGLYEEIKDDHIAEAPQAPPQLPPKMYTHPSRPSSTTTATPPPAPDGTYMDLGQTSRLVSQLSLEEKPFTVVAIDFGTAQSGFAYSHSGEKDNIMMNPNWGQNIGAAFYKSPTCVAVRKDEFAGFGFEAQQAYTDDDEDKVELYREFKMQLASQQNLGRKMMVKSDYKTKRSGEKSALKIFAMALSFLKDCFIHIVNQAGMNITVDQVRWVLTVPALWSDEQKSFMREAAAIAGLIRHVSSDNLIVALEPECASLYCRTINTNNFEGEQGNRAVNLGPGEEYIVIDAGGGTIDITVHRIAVDGSSEEVYQPSGLTVGGTNINKKFEELMERVLGTDFVRHCKNQHAAAWLNLILNFENKKKDVDEKYSKHLDLELHMGLSECFMEFKKTPLRSYINSLERPDVSITRMGKLRIDELTVRHMFKSTIDNIVNHIDNLLQDPRLANVGPIFLVGGFGQCAPLQYELKILFGKTRKVYIPQEPNLCVLRGAVMFGHRPNYITTRIARFTYALLISADYDKNKHDANRRQQASNGEEYVESLLPIILKGDPIPINSTKRIDTEPMVYNQTEVEVAIYASEGREVEDPNDKSVRRLGKITTHLPMSITDRHVVVEVTFGGTEIKVRGIASTGHIMEATLDMLQ